jgi:hypothetical protein
MSTDREEGEQRNGRLPLPHSNPQTPGSQSPVEALLVGGRRSICPPPGFDQGNQDDSKARLGQFREADWIQFGEGLGRHDRCPCWVPRCCTQPTLNLSGVGTVVLAPDFLADAEKYPPSCGDLSVSRVLTWAMLFEKSTEASFSIGRLRVMVGSCHLARFSADR